MFYLAALVLYLVQLYPGEVSFGSISPTLLGAFSIMVLAETVAVSRMWDLRPALFAILCLSFTATLLSSVRVTVYSHSNLCGGTRGAGYPLHWSFPSPISFCIPPTSISISGNPRPVIPGSLAALFLLLDIVFYAGIGLGVMESYGTVKQLLKKGARSHDSTLAEGSSN